jgi:two-component system, oxyanion-binding sensor
MSHLALDIGYVPLLDAAPLIVAREMGFAAEEGLDLRLHAEISWAALRDKLIWKRHQAAQMLSPMPIALSAGLGGLEVRIDALMVLCVNGEMIGVRPDLAARMGASALDFDDAAEVGKALRAAAGERLLVGVPFPISMHAELLHYWLRNLRPEGAAVYDIRTVSPPRMAQSMADHEIDAFCVGEPWGSVAAQKGFAQLILSGAAIWRFAPEKVLAVRHDWAESHPETAGALMRAVWRACQWIAARENIGTASELLARPEYLDVPAEILERPLRGRMIINAAGEDRVVAGAIEFFNGAATFPWRSQALWIAESMARRLGTDPAPLRAAAQACFRPDLYRAALGPAGADLPGASAKLEGALSHPTAVASSLGKLQLGPDRFFDGRVFDPD